jgi:hypothetical protein
MFFNIKSFKIVIENVQKLYEKTVPGGSRVGNGAAIDWMKNGGGDSIILWGATSVVNLATLLNEEPMYKLARLAAT